MVLYVEGLLELSELESLEAHLVRQYYLFAGCKQFIGTGLNIPKLICSFLGIVHTLNIRLPMSPVFFTTIGSEVTLLEPTVVQQ